MIWGQSSSGRCCQHHRRSSSPTPRPEKASLEPAWGQGTIAWALQLLQLHSRLQLHNRQSGKESLGQP